MSPTLLVFIGIGGFAGILSGLIGIGGGIIIVPALMLLAGFTQLEATGTSLAVLLLPVGIVAVLQYYKDGNVNVPAATTMAISFALCAWFGVLLAKRIPPMYLRFFFGIAIMIIGGYIAGAAFKKIS
jgi:uncharacterized membrane protein YfcA